MAIQNFKNKGTEDINYGRVTKQSLGVLPRQLHERAQIKLARISAATNLQDFRALPGNRFEMLKGNRRGQYSLRINDQYRICFKWDGENAIDIEIVGYH